MAHDWLCDFCGNYQPRYGDCCEASVKEEKQKKKEQDALCNDVFAALAAILRTGDIKEDSQYYISICPSATDGVQVVLNKNATQKLLGKISR